MKKTLCGFVMVLAVALLCHADSYPTVQISTKGDKVTYSMRAKPVSLDLVKSQAKRMAKFSTDIKWFVEANGSTSVAELHKVHDVIKTAGFTNIVCRVWLSSSNAVELTMSKANVEVIEDLEEVVEP
jgi:hypothetical protein